jgi:hypothetical protein
MSRLVRRLLVNQRTVFTLAFGLALLALTAFGIKGWHLPSWSERVTTRFATASPTPEDAVYHMLDAERAGDTRTYVDAFSGAMREQLLQLIRESSESKFSSYLARSAGFQGVAVTVTDRPSPEEAEARVDCVYLDRNDVQTLYLRREGDRWKILKVAGAEQTKSLFPFGSPVTD